MADNFFSHFELTEVVSRRLMLSYVKTHTQKQTNNNNDNNKIFATLLVDR